MMLPRPSARGVFGHACLIHDCRPGSATDDGLLSSGWTAVNCSLAVPPPRFAMDPLSAKAAEPA
jgi:hypothetical protein